MKFVLAVAALFVLTAQKPPAACTLLTPAELDAAVGMKVETPGYFTTRPIPRCGVLIPPKSEADMPPSADCMGEAKGFALSISVTIKDTKIPPAKVKALYDAAVKRLP